MNDVKTLRSKSLVSLSIFVSGTAICGKMTNACIKIQYLDYVRCLYLIYSKVTIVTGSSVLRLSEVACGESTGTVAPRIGLRRFCVRIRGATVRVEKGVLAYFWHSVANFGTIKRNLSAHIIVVLDAIFVPNLTFLCLLGPLKRKKTSHPHRPNLLRHPWTAVALHWGELINFCFD